MSIAYCFTFGITTHTSTLCIRTRTRQKLVHLKVPCIFKSQGVLRCLTCSVQNLECTLCLSRTFPQPHAYLFFRCVRPMCAHFFILLSLLYIRRVHTEAPGYILHLAVGQSIILILNMIDDTIYQPFNKSIVDELRATVRLLYFVGSSFNCRSGPPSSIRIFLSANLGLLAVKENVGLI